LVSHVFGVGEPLNQNFHQMKLKVLPANGKPGFHFHF
jgi:hypothetical protein